MKTTTLTTAALAAALLVSTAHSMSPPSETANRAFELRIDGRSDEARALLERSLSETDADASAWFELARTEFYHFEFDAAGQAIAGAIALAPENARYQYFAGMTATTNAVSLAHSAETRDQVEPEMEKAIASFERAVVIDPDFHEARLKLINMLVKTPSEHGGSRSKAKKHVEFLETKDAVYGARGRCMLMKSEKKMVKLWEKTVAAHETRADARVGLARARMRAGDLDQAAAQVDEAIRLDPTHRAILLTLCREYVSDGDHARAQQSVERYLAAPSPLPTPLRAYGTFCQAKLQQMQGNKAQAEAMLTEAKRLDPHCWTTYMEPPADLFDAP